MEGAIDTQCECVNRFLWLLEIDTGSMWPKIDDFDMLWNLFGIRSTNFANRLEPIQFYAQIWRLSILIHLYSFDDNMI